MYINVKLVAYVNLLWAFLPKKNYFSTKLLNVNKSMLNTWHDFYKKMLKKTL